MQDYEFLMRKANEAKLKAYAPYSNFRVGAALMTKDGKIFEGANIENAVFGAGTCAERSAFSVAISNGERAFSAIAISGDCESECFPCGICRQVMREFCNGDFVIALSDHGHIKTYTLNDLLPYSFGSEKLTDR